MIFFVKSLFVITLSLLLTRFVIPHQPFLMFFADNLLYKDFMQKMSGDDAGNLVEFLAISAEILVAVFSSMTIVKIIQSIFNRFK